MNLALFDLDGTLIEHDSDHAFGEFMVTLGWVDGEAFRQRFGNVSEQDGNPQPEAYRASKPGIPWHLPGCHRHRDKGRQQTADPDNKHDRIAPLGMWA